MFPRYRQSVLITLITPLLLAGCANRTGSLANRPGQSPVPPASQPAPQPPREQSDWQAVVAALGGAKKQSTRFASAAKNSARSVYAFAETKTKDLAAGQTIQALQGGMSACGFAWPSSGKISRGFSAASNHKGIDIMAPVGTPIYASRNGRVIYADNELSGFGNVIILQHDSGLTTFYAHNNRNFVCGGQSVTCGQVIAEIGQTGRASGPHLHFEIRQDGTAMDPKPLLP